MIDWTALKMEVARRLVTVASHVYSINPDREFDVRALDLALYQSNLSPKCAMRNTKLFFKVWGVALSPTIASSLFRPIPMDWLSTIYIINILVIAGFLLMSNLFVWAGYQIASHSSKSLRTYFNWTLDEQLPPHSSWARTRIYYLSRANSVNDI